MVIPIKNLRIKNVIPAPWKSYSYRRNPKHEVQEATEAYGEFLLTGPTPDQAEAILKILDVTILSKNNLTVITGKPKSRKTTLACALIKQSALRVAYIDTEQGASDVRKLMERLPDAAVLYTRGRSIVDKRRALKSCVDCNRFDLIVVDNVRDLLQDFNDNKQVSEVIELLMTASATVPILAIMHENRGSKDVRGLLGHDLEQKAECVVGVTLIDKNNPASGSIVDCRISRNEGFPEIFLTTTGRMHLSNRGVDGPAKPWQVSNKKMKKKKILMDLLSPLSLDEIQKPEMIPKIIETCGVGRSTAFEMRRQFVQESKK